MLKKISEEANNFAKNEIKIFNLPTLIHYELSMEKAIKICEYYPEANPLIVQIGIALMDCKLGETFKKKLSEHIKMSSDTTKSFFKDYKINNQDFAKIINCVEAHNGTIKFECIEAEICANADCYRFIHPKGVLSYLSTLARRSEYFQNNLNQLEKKLDEKYNIISLDLVKKELEPYYISFKQMIIESKK